MATPEERFPEVFSNTNIDPYTRKRTTPMKLLIIGMPRSATMSLREALQQLGFSAHHMVEVMRNPPDTKIWTEAVRAKKGQRPPLSLEEWDMALGQFDACLDFPSAAFMPELIKMYPDAKVMVCQREFESWYASVKRARNSQKSDLLVIPLVFLDGYFWKPFVGMMSPLIDMVFGKNATKDDFRRRHHELHEEVRKLVPKDKLLEYKVSEGWAPLCKFLDCEMPDMEFPRLNDGDTFEERAYWIRVLAYRRLWKQWSSTVYAFGVIGVASGAAFFWRGWS